MSKVIDQHLGAGGALLVVAGQAAGAHQVGEGPLDVPPFGQHHEPSPVVAAFDDRQHHREHGQAVLDKAAGVAAIGPDEGEQVVRVGHLLEQDLGGGPVPDVRAGDHHAQQQAEGSDAACSGPAFPPVPNAGPRSPV